MYSSTFLCIELHILYSYTSLIIFPASLHYCSSSVDSTVFFISKYIASGLYLHGISVLLLSALYFDIFYYSYTSSQYVILNLSTNSPVIISRVILCISFWSVQCRQCFISDLHTTKDHCVIQSIYTQSKSPFFENSVQYSSNVRVYYFAFGIFIAVRFT